MSYRVDVSAAVERAMLEYARFIAQDGASPLNAERWLAGAWQALESLQTFPRRWPRLAVHLPEELRRMVFGEHIVVFQIDDASRVINVIAWRHAKQDTLHTSESQAQDN